MDMFITLIVVMVSQVYVYIQTHQVVYIKYVPYFCISVILQCTCKKKKRTRKYSEVWSLLHVLWRESGEIWDLKIGLKSYLEEMLHKGVYC